MPTQRHCVKVYMTADELAAVDDLAARVRLPRSELLRRLATGTRLPSEASFEAAGAVRDLLRVNADLARLGNLFKLALDDEPPERLAGRLERLASEIAATKAEKRPDVRDDFAKLARYLAAARPGERLRDFWIVNCDAGQGLEDLETALVEVEAARVMKPEIENKTYHLAVSFGPGEAPSADHLGDMERRLAEALGFGGHQRVAATHVDTDNFHMHVAFNMVHPRTFKLHIPWNDYRALERTARTLEREYGLRVDLGMSDYRDGPRGSAKARDYEAHTWQRSFQNHLLDRRGEIAAFIARARSWQGLHEALADRFAVGLRRRGAGLAFVQLDGPQAMKASLLDAGCARAALEKRLGPYEPPREQRRRPPPPARRYRPRPLTRHPATRRLWRRYLGAAAPAGRRRANWKHYLLAEAINDPLAVAVVHQHFEVLHAMSDLAARRPRRMPAALRGALRTWAEKGTWALPRAPGGPASPRSWPGLKVDPEGRLMVPFRDAAGRVWGFRMIRRDGAALDVGDLARPGLRHAVDPGKVLGPGTAAVVTAEPHAVAALREATGGPVVLAPSAQAVESLRRALAREHRGLKTVAAPAGAASLGDEAWLAWAAAGEWADPGNNPWLRTAGVRGFGIRKNAADEVLIPLKDAGGRLREVLAVPPSGAARRLAGPAAAPGPLMHVIDPMCRLGRDTIAVAADYVSAAAIHRETRLPVAMAASPDQWAEVVWKLRRRYPDCKIVAALDAEARPGDDAAAAWIRAAVVRPPLGARSFGDLARAPADTVRRALAPHVGDRAFLMWDGGRPSDGAGERRAANGDRLLALWDAGGRLGGVQVLGAGGGPKEQLGQGDRDGLFQVVGGGAWRPVTLVGSRGRGDGILRKETYRGVLVYNRQRPVLDPVTGRKRRIINPESEWVISVVPHLRIVDDALWRGALAQGGAAPPELVGADSSADGSDPLRGLRRAVVPLQRPPLRLRPRPAGEALRQLPGGARSPPGGRADAPPRRGAGGGARPPARDRRPDRPERGELRAAPGGGGRPAGPHRPAADGDRGGDRADSRRGPHPGAGAGAQGHPPADPHRASPSAARGRDPRRPAAGLDGRGPAAPGGLAVVLDRARGYLARSRGGWADKFRITNLTNKSN